MIGKIPQEFYRRNDVVCIARELLGKLLVTNIAGQYTSGRIVETEAYAGATDRASHTWANRRTSRTEVMFVEGGLAYVYLCYGLHYLFNVVTGEKDLPNAVLIRALEPVNGLTLMEERHGKKQSLLTSGPGNLCKALGITAGMNGECLWGSRIWIEDDGMQPADIISGTRVGVAYAGEDALLPYRFMIKGDRWLSKGKGL